MAVCSCMMWLNKYHDMQSVTVCCDWMFILITSFKHPYYSRGLLKLQPAAVDMLYLHGKIWTDFQRLCVLKCSKRQHQITGDLLKFASRQYVSSIYFKRLFKFLVHLKHKYYSICYYIEGYWKVYGNTLETEVLCSNECIECWVNRGVNKWSEKTITFQLPVCIRGIRYVMAGYLSSTLVAWGWCRYHLMLVFVFES